MLQHPLVRRRFPYYNKGISNARARNHLCLRAALSKNAMQRKGGRHDRISLGKPGANRIHRPGIGRKAPQPRWARLCGRSWNGQNGLCTWARTGFGRGWRGCQPHLFHRQRIPGQNPPVSFRHVPRRLPRGPVYHGFFRLSRCGWYSRGGMERKHRGGSARNRHHRLD